MLLAALLIPLAVLAGTTASSADTGASGGTDAVAVAIPVQPGDARQATSDRVVDPWGRAIRATAVATTSVTCDGCTGMAVTTQVLYAGRVTSIRPDNVAAAWSQCTGCSGYALSLQVVIARSVRSVTAGNRSLAVNAACLRCHTAAAAVQIIVVTPLVRELSDSALQQIAALRDALVEQLQAQLNAAPATQTGAGTAGSTAAQGSARALSRGAGAVPAGLQAGATRIQQIVAGDLHATPAGTDVVVRTG
jgi:hypothetical protein